VNKHISGAVINTLQLWAASKPEIARLRVFGSRVLGWSKLGCCVVPSSDLDIAIELNMPADEQFGFWFHRWKDWRAELIPIVPFPVDLQLLEPRMSHIRRYVRHSGVVIYDRKTKPQR
jgi:hypothetical protein